MALGRRGLTAGQERLPSLPSPAQTPEPLPSRSGPLIPATVPEDSVKNFGKQVPTQRAGKPSELAAAYVLLPNPLSSYASGATLAVSRSSVPMHTGAGRRPRSAILVAASNSGRTVSG